ncbi:hypothetical protein M409DRAFT_57175 [Zasmidium cellare ATCC 36951]|uniref:Uncharacterized protein n=1 Tax=Zasmidium cellare ATCC 36951 TaxID=1080233 RepID=A0A6A6C9H4_ZASCE|nr:uncharacterized protein M409DRAFT_57175 [Zasmidium cellare ATCC 36951]KAF2163675.1 hypothetical protein M409DRAFT_57175 [Zasmidium cellare ATCC 36951]
MASCPCGRNDHTDGHTDCTCGHVPECHIETQSTTTDSDRDSMDYDADTSSNGLSSQSGSKFQGDDEEVDDDVETKKPRALEARGRLAKSSALVLAWLLDEPSDIQREHSGRELKVASPEPPEKTEISSRKRSLDETEAVDPAKRIRVDEGHVEEMGPVKDDHALGGDG